MSSQDPMTKSKDTVSRVIGRLVLISSVLTCFVGAASLFVAQEYESVIVTRLGRPTRVIDQGGLHLKWPQPFETIHRIDRRRRHFVLEPSTAFTADKRSIQLACYVIWHVDDPLRYLQSSRTPEALEQSLIGLITAAQGQQVAKFPLEAFASSKPEQIRVREIESTIASQINLALRSRLGIVVDQVGIERLSFPPENMTAVLGRMRAEREAAANYLRAEGARQAQAIRDDAHVKTQEILREGREAASKVAAAGEEDAAQRLADAYRTNPEFFRFWSSLQAARVALTQNTTLILSSDQWFFDSVLPQATFPPANPSDLETETRGLTRQSSSSRK